MKLILLAVLCAASASAQIFPGGGGSGGTVDSTARSSAAAAASQASTALTAAQTAQALAQMAAGVPTYFVDPAGSDSNNGTSAATPWRTIAKVNTTTLTAGQIVGFKAGGAWHEQLTVAQSGALNSQIVFTSYGTGAKPVISANDTVTGWSASSSSVWTRAQTANPGFVDFGGIPGIPVASQAAITTPNQWFWDGSAHLYVYSLVDPTPSVEIQARISAITSSGASYITVTGFELRGGTDTLYCGVATACSHWTVQRNTFDSTYSTSVRFAFNSGVATTSNLIDSNTFTGTGASPIGLANGGAGQNLVISNNTFLNICEIYVGGSTENAYCDATNLFSQTQSDGGMLVTGNTLQNSGNANATGYGGGFHCDTVTGCAIIGNTAVNTVNPGINLEKVLTGSATYNLCVSCGTGQYVAALDVSAGATYNDSNNVVTNNTIVGGWWPCGGGTSNGNTITGLTFKANICSGANPSSGTNFFWGDASYAGTGDTFTSNNFGPAGGCFINLNGSCYNTYGAAPSAVAGSTLQGAPLFNNAALSDYTQQASSPTWGIGAFPYSTSNPSAPATVTQVTAVQASATTASTTATAAQNTANSAISQRPLLMAASSAAAIPPGRQVLYLDTPSGTGAATYNLSGGVRFTVDQGTTQLTDCFVPGQHILPTPLTGTVAGAYEALATGAAVLPGTRITCIYQADGTTTQVSVLLPSGGLSATSLIPATSPISQAGGGWSQLGSVSSSATAANTLHIVKFYVSNSGTFTATAVYTATTGAGSPVTLTALSVSTNTTGNGPTNDQTPAHNTYTFTYSYLQPVSGTTTFAVSSWTNGAAGYYSSDVASFVSSASPPALDQIVTSVGYLPDAAGTFSCPTVTPTLPGEFVAAAGKFDQGGTGATVAAPSMTAQTYPPTGATDNWFYSTATGYQLYTPNLISGPQGAGFECTVVTVH